MKYQIKSNKTVVTFDTLGAELQSFNVNGIEYMHDANPKYWNRTAPYLFPNIGTIQDKYATVEGVKYPFGKHGFLRDTQMECTLQEENKLIFTLNSNNDTLSKYPFEFKLQIIYFLENTKLTTRIIVENKGNTVLPFNFGLHPAFRIPWVEGEKYEDYKITFNEAITCDIPTVVLTNGLVDWEHPINHVDNLKEFNLNHEDFSKDALVFEPYPKGPITITSPSGSKVSVTAYNFKTLGIWSPYPTYSPFVCIEPWIGCADKPGVDHEFSHKKDIIFLNPNELWSTSYVIEIK